MGRKRAFNVLVERRNGEKARPIIFSFILLYRRANFLSTLFALAPASTQLPNDNSLLVLSYSVDETNRGIASDHRC